MVLFHNLNETSLIYLKQEYSDLSHISRVSENNTTPPQQSYYIPLHTVLKFDSTTTKLCVVLNASSPTSNGVSLNNIFYTGPVLQPKINRRSTPVAIIYICF